MGETFHPSAACEFKPAGLRIVSRDTIAGMFRRSMPGLARSFAARHQLREWTNQNRLLREWSCLAPLPSGEMAPTNQLETIEFAEGLESIISYRIRMNALFSKLLDFLTLPGIERVPG